MSIANTKGVDISYWNGDIDLSKVKNAGYKWVMIRCGFGGNTTDQDDSRFESNVKKAEALGMPWGAYFYTYSLSAEQDKSELNHILRLLKGKKPTLPIAIDVEDADGYKSRNGGWNYANVNRNAKYLLEGLKKNGYYPMLYTGFEEIENYISKDVWQKYDMWFAHWAKKCGYTGSNLCMWQYGGETNLIDGNSISGVGTIDKDVVYKDYPTIIKNGGYNNWTKPSPITKGITIGCKSVHTYAWCQYAFAQTGAVNPKWSTSNTQISKIDSNGVLSTSAAGTTTVTVTDGKYSASVPVTIDAGRATGISKSSITLAKGQTSTLSAREKDVSWFSSNKNVATVSGGVVTAKASGYATISAYNKSGASTCLVHVTNETYKPQITEAQLRQKVANTINGWLGAREGDSTHAEILKIYNSQPNLDYRMSTHDAWCAATVSATWIKVGIAQYICTSVNCGVLRDKAIAKGIWVENDAYAPKVGDAVIYSWSDDGVGDNRGSADHVGIVVSTSGNTFIVTEGNMNNAVGQRTMKVNGQYIRGFIAPNYADIAKKVAGKISPDSSSGSVAAPSIYTQGVADGRWLKVIKDGTTYSGIIGKALVALAAKVTEGTITYSVHLTGGKWLGDITGWNYKDYINGYAGSGNPAQNGASIDAIRMYYKTPQNIVNKYGYYKVAYRVHLINGGWLDWQYDTETTNGQDGYAGIYGTIIDGVQVKLVKA